MEIEILWESKEISVWNGIQLVLKMAMDVEWYSKPVSLEIKSIVYRIWKGMIDKLFKSYHLGIKRKKWSGMQLVFKRSIDVEWHSKTALYWETVLYWESVMSDVLLQFNWDSKNTLTSIYFYIRKGTGITDKLRQLESLN